MGTTDTDVFLPKRENHHSPDIGKAISEKGTDNPKLRTAVAEPEGCSQRPHQATHPKPEISSKLSASSSPRMTWESLLTQPAFYVSTQQNVVITLPEEFLKKMNSTWDGPKIVNDLQCLPGGWRQSLMLLILWYRDLGVYTGHKILCCVYHWDMQIRSSKEGFQNTPAFCRISGT